MADFFPGQTRKKITSLFNSERRYSRSGSITTTAFQKQEGIRGSRIMNLPNYKKQTLQCRLDFVVVFQTIEIERLSVQIESLRVRLADSERQIFNYKNYEVQIKELTERCFDFERERARHEQEVGQLEGALAGARRELQAMREKCVVWEQAVHEQQDVVFGLREELIIQRKQREQVEDHRLQLQSCIKEKEKMHSRKLKEMEKSTQLRRNEVSKSEQNLGNLLKKYQEEVNALQRENLNLRNLYDSIERQTHEMEQRCDQLQEELMRTHELLKQREFEVEGAEQEYKERVEALEQRYEDQCQQRIKRADESEHQAAEWRAAVERMEGENEKYELKLIEYQEQCERYQNLLNEAGDEIDRLNTIIKDKIKYLQAWQGRYKELQQKNSTLEEEVNAMTQRMGVDQKELGQVSQSLRYKSDQLEKIEKMREAEARAVRQKLAELQEQRQQLASLRKDRDQEREDFRRMLLENSQIKDQLNRRVQEGNKLFDQLNKAEGELKEARLQLSARETAVRSLQEELRVVKAEVANWQGKTQKAQGQRRVLQQQAMRIKAFEERVNHLESKKNEYLNQIKRVTHKLKESDKQLTERNNRISLLQADIGKYEKYSGQLEDKINQLEGKLAMMEQLKNQILILTERAENTAQEIAKLQKVIINKSKEVDSCKEKITLYDKAVKQFRDREDVYKQQLVVLDRLGIELKQLKAKYENLQDKNEQLEINIANLTTQRNDLTKENGSLQRVIFINSEELKRTEALLSEAREQVSGKKAFEKEMIGKIKQAERKLKASQQQLEKSKGKWVKERQEMQKNFQKKSKQFQNQFRSVQSQRERALQTRQKQLKQVQSEMASLLSENNSLREVLKRNEQEKENINRYSKQIEKKLLSYEHELERTTESFSQTRKELEISRNNIERMNSKGRQSDQLIRDQAQRITQILVEKENLMVLISDLNASITSKKEDCVQLLNDNKRFQTQIASMILEMTMHQETESEMANEIIKTKFQAQHITQSYNSLNTRMANFEVVIAQLKQKLGQTLQFSQQLSVEKEKVEKKSIEYQERLVAQIQKFQELQFAANQQIIRLQTMVRLLQIQIGEFKERESALVSIVREGSLIKQRKQEITPQKKIIETPSKKASTTASRTAQKSMRDDFGQVDFPHKDYNKFLSAQKESYRGKEMNFMKESKLTKESQMLKKSNLLKESTMLKESHFLKEIVMKESLIGQLNLTNGKSGTKHESPLQISYCQKSDGSKIENPLAKSKRVYFQNIVLKQN